jgi:hypothetical protein
MGLMTPDVAASLGLLNNKMQEVPVHAVKASEALMQVGSSLMSISSMLTSMRSFADTIFTNEDADAIDYITGAISLLTTTLFAYNAVSTLSSKLRLKHAGAAAADAAATTGDTVAKAANTASTWANTLALLSNPWTIGFAAAAVAAGAIIFSIAKGTAEAEKNTEAI